ncbi:hypothetical protein SeMB42_g05177 [Synchytrium endobioticum]|nr:hypothetical protein SeMB42_g05177 [Synchytrium endobioticum]
MLNLWFYAIRIFYFCLIVGGKENVATSSPTSNIKPSSNTMRPALGTLTALPGHQTITHVMYCITITFTGTVGLVSLLVLYGLPLFDKVEPTWLASIFIASLVILPAANALAAGEASWTRLLSFRPETNDEKTLLYTFIACLVGMWVGGFAMPLDWNQPWQVWPAPTYLGGFLGYSLATLFTSVVYTI